MRTVHKYEIPVDQPHILQLPLESHVVHVGADFPGTVTAWVLLDLTHDVWPYRFRVVETGHPIDAAEIHVGAVPIGNRVVHLVVAE